MCAIWILEVTQKQSKVDPSKYMYFELGRLILLIDGCIYHHCDVPYLASNRCVLSVSLWSTSGSSTHTLLTVHVSHRGLLWHCEGKFASSAAVVVVVTGSSCSTNWYFPMDHVSVNCDVCVAASWWEAKNWKPDIWPYLKTSTSSNAFHVFFITVIIDVLVCRSELGDPVCAVFSPLCNSLFSVFCITVTAFYLQPLSSVCLVWTCDHSVNQLALLAALTSPIMPLFVIETFVIHYHTNTYDVPLFFQLPVENHRTESRTSGRDTRPIHPVMHCAVVCILWTSILCIILSKHNIIIHTPCLKKLCKIVFVRTSSNFHQFW